MAFLVQRGMLVNSATLSTAARFLAVVACLASSAACTRQGTLAGLQLFGAALEVTAAVARASAPAAEPVVLEERAARVSYVQTRPTSTGFDAEVARAALSAVEYADCGGTSDGEDVQLQITFSWRGVVADVAVIERPDRLSTAATSCIRARFAAVRVPVFAVKSRTVAWRIRPPMIVVPEAM